MVDRPKKYLKVSYLYIIIMTTNTIENWRIHHIYDLYMGSTEGRVMHIKTGNIPKPTLLDGYGIVSVRGASMKKKQNRFKSIDSYSVVSMMTLILTRIWLLITLTTTVAIIDLIIYNHWRA